MSLKSWKPLTAPLWQAPGFIQINNIVDAPSILAPSALANSGGDGVGFGQAVPRLCHHTWLASGQLV